MNCFSYDYPAPETAAGSTLDLLSGQPPLDDGAPSTAILQVAAADLALVHVRYKTVDAGPSPEYRSSCSIRRTNSFSSPCWMRAWITASLKLSSLNDGGLLPDIGVEPTCRVASGSRPRREVFGAGLSIG